MITVEKNNSFQGICNHYTTKYVNPPSNTRGNQLLELLLLVLLSGSLNQLQAESSQETAYRAEMENYVTSNNFLSGPNRVQLNSFNDTKLEELVKAQMKGDMGGVYGILADKWDELIAPEFESIEPIINPKQQICKILEC